MRFYLIIRNMLRFVGEVFERQPNALLCPSPPRRRRGLGVLLVHRNTLKSVALADALWTSQIHFAVSCHEKRKSMREIDRQI